MPRTLSLTTLDTLDESLRDEWNRLAGDKLFRRFEWAKCWLDTFGEGAELRIVVVRERIGRLVGVAPLCLRRHGSLELVGGDKACGDDLSVLAAPDRLDDVTQALAGWLASERRCGAWDELWLTGVDPSDPTAQSLRESLAASGVKLLPIVDQSRWVRRLPESFEAHLSGLSKSSRRVARTTLKLLDTEGSGYALEFAADEPSRARLLEEAKQLHELRWESDPCGGCFSHEHFTPFIDAVTREWLAAGVLRLAVLRCDGKPAACAVAASFAGTWSVYLTGRDPAYDDRHAGWMLNYALLRMAIAEGASVFDLLRGDEPYKHRLGARPTPQATYYAAGRGLVNSLRGLSQSGRETLRRWRRMATKPAAEEDSAT
jgi:CelD/BcsL family acetyltransferase involved in cellulose biosynthesis